MGFAVMIWNTNFQPIPPPRFNFFSTTFASMEQLGGVRNIDTFLHTFEQRASIISSNDDQSDEEHNRTIRQMATTEDL